MLGKQRHLLLSEMLSKKRCKYPLKFTISGRFKHGFVYILYYKTILSYLIWKVIGLQEKVAMHNKSFLLYLVVSVLQCHTESIRFARLDSHSFCTVYRKKTKFCNSKETLLNVYNIKSKSKTWKSWIMQENILVFSLEFWIGMSNYCHQNNMQDVWKLKKNPCYYFLLKKKTKQNINYEVTSMNIYIYKLYKGKW